MNEASAEKTAWQKLIGFLDRGITGIVIGGFVSTLYFWLAIEKPKLCYAINPVRTTIVKAGKLSNLKVAYGNHEITNDLTIVQIAIWNKGSKAIHHEEILEPVVLHAKGPAIMRATIYEAGLKSTRMATAMTINHLAGSPKVGIDWKVLEHDDGGLFTLFYEGDENLVFEIDGTIEGQRSIGNPSGIPQLLIIILLIGGLVLIVGLLGLLKKTKLITQGKSKRNVVTAFVVISIMVGWFCLFIKILTAADKQTPFGF
jgi:hypothetical protein